MKTVTRKLEIDAGHRLTRHESKCRNVHGHRYVFEVTVGAEDLDDVGRVIDFGVVKAVIGGWLDEHWDHGFIYQFGDPVGDAIAEHGMKTYVMMKPPTAENLATLLHKIGRELLEPFNVEILNVCVFETPNCWADSAAAVNLSKLELE